MRCLKNTTNTKDIVYRGDRITNIMCDHVFFSENETATTPATIAALNLTLWYGAMSIVSCADCIRACLQCKLDGSTWVILPFEHGYQNGNSSMTQTRSWL